MVKRGSVVRASSIRRRSAAWTILRDWTFRSRRRASALWMAQAVGIGGSHKLSLIQTRETLVALTEEIPVSYFLAEGSQLSGEMIFKGSLTKLSSKRAEV